MSTGTYFLITRLEKTRIIKIGRKDLREFPAGYYVYVGSAMNNLDKRIGRHLSKVKCFHWHIDWLLAHSCIAKVKRIESEKRLECTMSRTVQRYSLKTVMQGFGSSDCRCDTHLHYFKTDPEIIIDNAVCHRLSQVKLNQNHKM